MGKFTAISGRVAVVVIACLAALTVPPSAAAELSSVRALDAAPPTNDPVSRVAGADRYGTSAAVSAGAFPPGVPVAYIATGATFPDALSGAAAAGALGGPVLLTAPDAIPSAVHTELKRLKPAKIVIARRTRRHHRQRQGTARVIHDGSHTSGRGR